MVSIRQPLERATRPAHRQPAWLAALPKLPNFCNLGVMLRLLLLVNLLCVAATLIKAPDLRQFQTIFLAISVVVQPALIASLLLLCGARKLAGEEAPGREFALFGLVAMVIGVLSYNVMSIALPLPAQMSPLQFTMVYVLLLMAVLFYFDTRVRALSPALIEARLQALQARIRPHFLFNSMNAALSLIRADPQRAERVLENLAELFRALMQESRKLVRLDEEVNLCMNYLEIEQLRLGERLTVDWRIASLPNEARVPPLLLQPLVENAVYHGIEPLDGPGTLSITIEARGREVHITIANPLPPPRKDLAGHAQGNRMALNNIRERLSLHFDAEARLSVSQSTERYQVSLVLPITEQFP